jgi:hypothetical protein
MHIPALSAAAALVSLPFLAAASPVLAPTGISIPISKRSAHERGGVADIAALRDQLVHLERLVPWFCLSIHPYVSSRVPRQRLSTDGNIGNTPTR